MLDEEQCRSMLARIVGAAVRRGDVVELEASLIDEAGVMLNPWRGYTDYLVCNSCEGRPGNLISETREAQLYLCDGCHGLIGRAPSAVVAGHIGLEQPMWRGAEPPDLRYFDIQLTDDDSGRVTGWYSPTLRRICRFKQ